MKIKEVLLKEMGSRGAVPTPANPGYQVDPSGPANIGNQSFTGMQGQATQKAAPKKAAPKKAAAKKAAPKKAASKGKKLGGNPNQGQMGIEG
jgi:hypothetical protein